MEVEILRAAQEVGKKAVAAQRVRAVTAHRMTTICAVLSLARRTAYYRDRARPAWILTIPASAVVAAAAWTLLRLIRA